jgi:hypothetical protein
MVPPIDDPVAKNPVAIPLLFLNQCPITAVMGPNRIPELIWENLLVSVHYKLYAEEAPQRQTLGIGENASIEYIVQSKRWRL